MESLPTPPGTGHRPEKRRSQSVLWSPNLVASATLKTPQQTWVVPAASAGRLPPTKSILKATGHRANALATINENEREATPEPEDPMSNLSYLDTPVKTIIGNSHSSLRDIVDAYVTLNIRVRLAIAGTDGVDGTWPLFEPVRRHTQEIADSLVRDLGRAHVDPSLHPRKECEEIQVSRVGAENEFPSSSLPSPKGSPRSTKKGGLSEEEVKYARDLCNIVHSVLKLLAMLFTMPEIYCIFSHKQLESVFTAIISIPMAERIPTPNARKTCSLAMWLIQQQRLPAEVLFPTSDRLMYALRRGIDGELGKEGKKGSMSEGLRSVHDLTLYQPSTFVQPFAELLPSILDQLLAPTLNMRSQACHALGGFTHALMHLPRSDKTEKLRKRVSDTVAEYISKDSIPAPTPTTPKRKESMLIRTIRTTLQNAEPTAAAAQGPVWGLLVLANLIALLGPALVSKPTLNMLINSLLSVSLRHKKSSIRGLAAIVWRVVAWVHFQSPWPKVEGGKDLRLSHWKVIKSVVDFGAGVATVAALLTFGQDGEQDIQRAIEVVESMIQKGGFTTNDGMETLKTLVSSETEVAEWDLTMMLARGLFSCHPGIMTADPKALPNHIRLLSDQGPSLPEIRPLTPEEISKPSVFDALAGLLKSGMSNLELTQENDRETPLDIITVWAGLMRQPVILLKEREEDATEFGLGVATTLIGILESPEVNLARSLSTDDNTLPVTAPNSPTKLTTTHVVGVRSPIKVTKPRLHTPAVGDSPSTRSNEALKMTMIRDLWICTRTTIPKAAIGPAASRLLNWLVEHCEQLAGVEGDVSDERSEWIVLCAEVLVACELDEVRVFLLPGLNKVWDVGFDATMWREFVERWAVDLFAHWEHHVVLLAAPHAFGNRWDMSSEEHVLWDNLLSHAIKRAEDYNVDSVQVVDRIAQDISEMFLDPASGTSIRIADSLLIKSDFSQATESPQYILDMVNDTMVATYPPAPEEVYMSTWLVHSFTTAISNCPREFILNLFEAAELSLATWIGDERSCFNKEDYETSVVTMYEMLCLSVHNLAPKVEDLDKIVAVLESGFMGRGDKPDGVREAFVGFWQASFGTVDVPEGGWSERAQACLVAAGITPGSSRNALPSTGLEEEEVFEILSRAPVHEEEEGLVFPESDDEVDSPSVVKTAPSTPCIPAAISPLKSYPTLEIPTTPTRPTRTLSRVFTLPPPPKVYAEAPSHPTASSSQPTIPDQLIPSLFASPITLASTTTPRTPCTPSNPPPAKRRRIGEREDVNVVDDKENTIFVSVAEDAGLPSPELAAPSVRAVMSLVALNTNAVRSPVRPSQLGKRKKEDLSEEPEQQVEEIERSAKRVCVELPTDPVEPINLVSFYGTPKPLAVAANSPPEPERTASVDAPAPIRRVFMKSVRMPTLASLGLRKPAAPTAPTAVAPGASLRRSASMIMVAAPPPARRPLRLTRSAARIHGSDAFEEPSPEPVRLSKRKRTQSAMVTSTSKVEGDPFRESLPASDPISLPSESSIMFSESEDAEMERSGPVPSSDDDPRIGQVTPHHIISPALRRLRDTNYEDPPSDDSNMSLGSPSRDAVTRKTRTKIRFASDLPTYTPLPHFDFGTAPEVQLKSFRPRAALPSEKELASRDSSM